MVGVAERLDKPLCADAVLAVLLGDSWAGVPMPPRGKRRASMPSTDIVVCLRTSVGACMSGMLR